MRKSQWIPNDEKDKDHKEDLLLSLFQTLDINNSERTCYYCTKLQLLTFFLKLKSFLQEPMEKLFRKIGK